MGYTRLAYLKSTGTQYIDTGFTPNQDTRVVMDCFIDSSASSGTFVFAVRESANSKNFGAAMGTGYEAFFAYGSTYSSGTLDIYQQRLVIDANKNTATFTANGSTEGIQIESQAFECANTLALLALKQAGAIYANTYMAGKVYSCQVYDNDVLVRDFIPMMDEVGVCGLYDKVEGKFYTSPNGELFEGVREDNGLPFGYMPCEYIQSFGEEYIDTGFVPNQDTRVVMDVDLSDSTSSCAYFGARTSNKENTFTLFNVSGTSCRSDYGTNQIALDIDPTSRIIIDKNKNVTTIGDVTTTDTEQTFESGVSMYILTVNTNDTAYYTPLAVGKVYSCQIYDNDVLVRDYIPCQSPTRVYGLFDKVNGVFYTTSTGAFTGKWSGEYFLKIPPQEFRQRLFNMTFKGNLPSGYYACEYIESSGTQYIDTEYKVTSNNLKVDFDFLYTASHSNGSIFGSERSTSPKYTICPYGDGPAFWVGASTSLLELNTSLNTRYKLSAHANNGALSVYLNNEALQTSYSGSLNPDNSIYLCANNINNSASQFTSIKIYSCQIYDNGIMVRDFVPCMTVEGEYGLYDKVNGVFYPSASTTGFTGKLKDVNSFYTFPEKLTLDGSALIDTNYKPNQNTKVIADLNIEAYSDQSALFGVRESGKSFLMFTGDNNKGYQADLGSLSSSSVANSYSSSGRVNFELYIETGVATFKTSVSTITFGNVSSFQSTYNMYLGTINNNGTPMFDYPFRGDVYSFQIYESDVLVCDFVPAIDPMGESGLYDKVNGTFHKANMVGLPDGYAYVDGVYSNGNAYIDTGLVANKGDDIIMEMDALFQSPSSWGGANWYLQYNNSTSLDERTLIRVEWQNNVQTTYENGVLKDSTDRNNATATNQRLGLFKLGSTDSWATQYAGQVGYMYSCKIWKDGVLVRDYIPCKNLSTGEQGLYDKVNDVFYTSSGTSSFGDKALYTADFDYTGGVQSVTLGAGTYKLQVWGAQGGVYPGKTGNSGGYSEGVLTLTESTTIYVVVGGQPTSVSSGSAGTTVPGGYNGGGSAKIVSYNSTTTYAQGGGGGTDIRIGSNSLYARVIVAGGGAGKSNLNTYSRDHSGGGYYGGGGYSNVPFGGQTPNENTDDNFIGSYLVHGTFGVGASASPSSTNYKYASSGGGGGWYGGGTYDLCNDNCQYYTAYCGGGSGYIYCSLSASRYPSGCCLSSKYYLTSAKTVGLFYNDGYTSTNASYQSGLTYEYNPREGSTGLWGHGYARITQLS